MSNQNRKHKLFEVDRSERAARRSKLRTVKRTNIQERNGQQIARKQEYQTSQDEAETRQVLTEAAQSFIATIEFYKSEFGGAKSHDEAVIQALQCYEARRGYVQGLAVEEINWGHIAAVAEASTDDALDLWARVRRAADDELESGKRGAKVAGENSEPFALARYLAIRDAFADQWKPQGGIESAMIEMMAVAYSSVST